MVNRLKRLLLGAPRDVQDPAVHRKISLIALLAWVGLGADGLSSSAYGPEEAFRTLGEHTYLAIALALAMTFTVLIISYAYSRLIEHFPYGGGGYVVATQLLGPRFGVVSGSALLVDYVLTIFISVGVVDAVAMKGAEEVERVRTRTADGLRRYVRLARGLGLAADHRQAVGVEVLTEAEELCKQVAREFPKAMFFANKLIFEEERWYQRVLHNETGYQLQRRLQFAGLPTMVMPIRVFTNA